MNINSNIRRFASKAAAPLALLLLTAGCGGGGGGRGGPSGPTQPGGPGQTVLAPNVTVLPSDGSVQISNVTATGLTLTGNVPALKAGDIILSTTGNGLMRNIVSIQPSSSSSAIRAHGSTSTSTVTVITTQASLEQALQSCNLSFNKTLGAADFKSFISATGGVTFTPGSGSANAPFHLHIDPAVLSGSASVGIDVDVGFNIAGNLTITPSSGLLGTVQNFSLTGTISATETLAVNANANASLAGDVTLGTFTGKPVFFGDSPIVIVPVYELHANASGQVSASLSWTPQVTESLTAGFSYSAGSGWTPIAKATATGSNLAPQGTINSEINITPIAPKVSWLIEGVVGPEISGNLPTLQLQGNYTNDGGTQTGSLAVNAVFGAGGGLSSPIFSTLNKNYPNLVSDTILLYSIDTQTYTYTYVGPNLTNSYNSGLDGGPLNLPNDNALNHITASITFANPLPHNNSESPDLIPPIAWTISDGTHVLDSESTNLVGPFDYAASTDSSGKIKDYWMSVAFGPAGTAYGAPFYSDIYVRSVSNSLSNDSNSPLVYDSFINYMVFANGYTPLVGAYSTVPGTWSGPVVNNSSASSNAATVVRNQSSRTARSPQQGILPSP